MKILLYSRQVQLVSRNCLSTWVYDGLEHIDDTARHYKAPYWDFPGNPAIWSAISMSPYHTPIHPHLRRAPILYIWK